MVMYEAGMLARSKAGHDKAQMYIIKEVDDTYVHLVDGRIRTLGHPKKKKKKPVAKRQRMGVLAMTAEASENIEKLVSILLTFSPEQMAEFVASAREIITQYK